MKTGFNFSPNAMAQVNIALNQIQPDIKPAAGGQISADARFNPDLTNLQKAQYPVEQAHQRSHNLEFIGRERESQDFARASKHSKRVGLLKYLLPVTAFVIISLIISALVVRQQIPANITIGNTGIEDGKLVMSNPRLNGFDPKKRPYSVEAVRAIQSVEDPTHVEMEKIKAKLPMEDGIFANVVAGNGSYDATEKKLELGGGIDIVTTDGMVVKMTDAYVDLKAGTMKTHRAIKFTSEKASISAQTMEIYENGDHIIFDTNVRLVLQPAEEKNR